MKKILGVFLGVWVAFLGAVELKVGASAVPHAQILEFIKEDLAQDGVELKVVVFSDYVTPNLALNDGSIDANYFQHKPYLEKMIADRGLKLKEEAKIHIEPLGVYSKRCRSIATLKKNAKVAIPNDPTNGARALILLHNEGVIKLRNPSNLSSTTFDIIENPKKIKIIPMDAATLPRILGDMDAVVINGNYALQAGLSHKSALALEDSRSSYANIIATRVDTGDKQEAINKLIKHLKSQKVKDFMEKRYGGEVIAVFE
ncbi:MetQ/NlpA family ABC transporter substrate-binding protein [Helicobacter brantae]|uniref:Methionine ABC transporter substrate-binding protein n=1 Tax=Helicobacter brantae TaxID=375927 RepID=A0A3D8J4V2_9HELI|nr:MetQ/NlpA family ABC transporter substrate-binding protein [Helicobacter brantae]RDU72175.1 methionine ABC transporter substrate-binding protein [Helicobacter brantae]